MLSDFMVVCTSSLSSCTAVMVVSSFLPNSSCLFLRLCVCVCQTLFFGARRTVCWNREIHLRLFKEKKRWNSSLFREKHSRHSVVNKYLLKNKAKHIFLQLCFIIILAMVQKMLSSIQGHSSCVRVCLCMFVFVRLCRRHLQTLQVVLMTYV